MSEQKSFSPDNSQKVELLLLRHGEVLSHQGDVAVTANGLDYARSVGAVLGRAYDYVSLMSGDTLRARQTAEAVMKGARETLDLSIEPPKVAHALRNPDIYLAGTRVNMVSSAENFAEQVDGISAADVLNIQFFSEFLSAKDRIKYWLQCQDVPGENSADMAKRLLHFARSLVRLPAEKSVYVAVSHSPLIRACMVQCLEEDPGEPNYVSGLKVVIAPDGNVSMGIISCVTDEILGQVSLEKVSV